LGPDLAFLRWSVTATTSDPQSAARPGPRGSSPRANSWTAPIDRGASGASRRCPRNPACRRARRRSRRRRRRKPKRRSGRSNLAARLELCNWCAMRQSALVGLPHSPAAPIQPPIHGGGFFYWPALCRKKRPNMSLRHAPGLPADESGCPRNHALFR
jgi:hypothetical protein